MLDLGFQCAGLDHLDSSLDFVVFFLSKPINFGYFLTVCRCSFIVFINALSCGQTATKEIVALKQIKFDSDMVKEGFPVTALREINVLLSLSHESIVSVKEMVVGSGFDKVFMVMEVSVTERTRNTAWEDISGN